MCAAIVAMGQTTPQLSVPCSSSVGDIMYEKAPLLPLAFLFAELASLSGDALSSGPSLGSLSYEIGSYTELTHPDSSETS